MATTSRANACPRPVYQTNYGSGQFLLSIAHEIVKLERRMPFKLRRSEKRAKASRHGNRTHSAMLHSSFPSLTSNTSPILWVVCLERSFSQLMHKHLQLAEFMSAQALSMKNGCRVWRSQWHQSSIFEYLPLLAPLVVWFIHSEVLWGSLLGESRVTRLEL
jgi:hypothetical protein